jgi:hypothetical protein
VSEAHRALFTLAQERRSIEGEVAALSARERDARAGVAVQEELAARMLRIQYRQGAPDRPEARAAGPRCRDRSRGTWSTTTTSSARAPS